MNVWLVFAKCEKVCVWLGYKLRDFILRLMYYHNISYAVNLLSSEYIHSISPKNVLKKMWIYLKMVTLRCIYLYKMCYVDNLSDQ